MENQLYIRVRGRVLGPYDKEKLQSLAQRGQLSRMHELSHDASNWVRASTYPELFVGDEASRGAPAQQAAIDGQGVSLPGADHSPTSGRRWWYRKNGAESGPVDQGTLQQTLASGLLAADDLVWTEGMPQWLPARHVPGIVPPTQTASWPQQGAPIAPVEQKDQLPATLSMLAGNSRPWVLFLAVILFVYAGLAVALGIFALIHGANIHRTEIVASGLFWLIIGVDGAAGGLILSTYGSRLGSLRYSTHTMVLEKALESLRTFWIYVSINVIVSLAFLLSAVVWLIAATGTISIPGF